MDIKGQGSESFLESVKRSIANMNISSSDVIRYVSSFGVGFLAGLLLKRYSKYIIAFVVFTVLLLSVLHYFNFIVVHQEKIKMLFGFQATETCEMIIKNLLLRARINFIEVGSFIFGCLLGFKVG